MNFAKFLRTLVLTRHLRWLLLIISLVRSEWLEWKRAIKNSRSTRSRKIKTSVGTSVTTITNNWTTPHKFSYISNFFISNSRLKLAENIARAKQQPEAELMLFENYTLSSSTLSSQNNKAYFKRREKSMCLCFKENKWKWKWVEVKINHIVRHK